MRNVWIVIMALMMGVASFAATHRVPEALRAEQIELEKAFQANPNSAETRFELAMSYAYTGWIELGWEILRTIPKYDKNYADTVVPKYTALIKKEPDNWKYHFKLGFGYYFQDDKDLALKSFEKVTELNPKNAWGFGFVALLKGEQKKYNEVIKICDHALKIEPNGTALHFLQAEAYRQKKQYLKVFRKSITIVNLKAAEAKYRPTPFTDEIQE